MTRSHQHHSHALFANLHLSLYPPLYTGMLSGSFWTSPTGFPKLINLVIFLTVLYLLLRKPAREFFRQRLASVRESLDRAAREKQSATTKMAELDSRLNRLDAELQEIKAQSNREAAAERGRMETETRKDIEKIRETAGREIEAAKQVAMADLREFAATKAVDLAEQMIRREMTPADDAKLVARVGEEMSSKK
ncbi:MAG TPA: ATP synthase F0 subunit B [Blastocatellia bacterium]|nr:ATP synthase F0 subunit B [Blastocatellia bacterium]